MTVYFGAKTTTKAWRKCVFCCFTPIVLNVFRGFIGEFSVQNSEGSTYFRLETLKELKTFFSNKPVGHIGLQN